MASQELPDDPWTGFAMSVFAVNGRIIQAGEGIVGPLGQSSARWQVLGRAFDGATVASIARDIGHARQSTQRVADRLVADGLVKYKTHPTDRRTQVVELTDQGRHVLEQIYERQLEWSRAVVEALGENDLTAATRTLCGIAARLDELTLEEKAEQP